MSKSNGSLGLMADENGIDILAENLDAIEPVVVPTMKQKRIAKSAVFQLVKSVRKDILFTGDDSYTTIELVRKNRDENVAVWLVADGATSYVSPTNWNTRDLLVFKVSIENFVHAAAEHKLFSLKGIQRVVDTFWFATNGDESVVLGKDSKGDFYQSDFIALLNDDSYTIADFVKKVRAMCNRAENNSKPTNQRVSVYAKELTIYGAYLLQNDRTDSDLKKHLAK